MDERHEHQKIILPIPRDKVSARKTFFQMSREIGLFLVKNPKWFLEWMLVGLVAKLMMSGELTFEVIRKFVKQQKDQIFPLDAPSFDSPLSENTLPLFL